MKQTSFDLSTSPLPPQNPAVFSVSELTRRIKSLLEAHFPVVIVEGEVSNYRQSSAGHHYFSLKDEFAVIGCVLFAGSAGRLRGLSLANGIAVRVEGDLSVYGRSGQYQIIVRSLEPAGIGLLQAKFEALKTKLHAEGLFAAERKRPLPRWVRRVGLITSRSGAVLHDFLNVLWRRSPGIEVVFHDAPVQGRGAALRLAEAVANLNALPEHSRPEVIVLARGGGSMEDLWEFNEEVLVRAVAASAIPTVSAVGHEVDTTLCDYAADLRAPTPSAAAELLSRDAAEMLGRLLRARLSLRQGISRAVSERQSRLQRALRSIIWRSPQKVLAPFIVDTDRRLERLLAAGNNLLRTRREKLLNAETALRARDPRILLKERRSALELRRRRLLSTSAALTLRLREKLNRQQAALRAYDPRAVLTRGYALVFGKDGGIIKTASSARETTEVRLHFADGQVPALIQNSSAGQP